MPMEPTPSIRFDDLLDAFDWVSADPTQNSAYVSRRTGLVHWDSETMELDDELPEDIEDASVYVALPCKSDLDLGRDLAQRFTQANIPQANAQVAAFFHHRGAYGKFKNLLERQGLLDAWHAYEAGEVESALRAWAAEQGLTVEPSPRPGTASLPQPDRRD